MPHQKDMTLNQLIHYINGNFPIFKQANDLYWYYILDEEAVNPASVMAYSMHPFMGVIWKSLKNDSHSIDTFAFFGGYVETENGKERELIKKFEFDRSAGNYLDWKIIGMTERILHSYLIDVVMKRKKKEEILEKQKFIRKASEQYHV